VCVSVNVNHCVELCNVGIKGEWVLKLATLSYWFMHVLCVAEGNVSYEQYFFIVMSLG